MNLTSEYLSWGRPTLREFKWLWRQGIAFDALVRPLPIGAANVRFTSRSFEIAEDGERALTLPMIDAGEVVDLAAWQPKTKTLKGWAGRGFALGQEEIFNPGVYAMDGALHVHETPLEWLRAGRTGIVIVRPSLSHAYLAGRERLAFDNAAFARRVKGWMRPPKARAELLVATKTDEAA